MPQRRRPTRAQVLMQLPQLPEGMQPRQLIPAAPETEQEMTRVTRLARLNHRLNPWSLDAQISQLMRR